jgi:DNA-binding beta-propeller fold protein YncE
VLAVLAPVWIGLAILVSTLVGAFIVRRFIRPSPGRSRILGYIAVAILVLFALEVALVAAFGAVGLYERVGSIVLPLNAVLGWSAAAALACLLLTRSERLARWWPLVGFLAGLLTIAVAFYRIGVRDQVEVAQGRAQTPIAQVQKNGPPAYLLVPSFTSNVVTVFDLSTHARVKAIPLGSKGACCVYPLTSGTKAYVVSGLAPHVSVLDVARLEMVKRIQITDTMAEAGSRLQSDERMFWVGEIGKAYVEGIDTQTDSIVHSYVGGGGAMHVGPDGKYVFSIMSYGDPHLLTVREAATGKQVGELALPVEKGEVASSLFIDPRGAKAYLTLFSERGGVLVIDVHDPLHPRYLKTIRTGAITLVGTFSPEGDTLWLPNAGAGTVSVVDVASDAIVHTIELNRYVSAIEFAGDYAYIAQSPSIRKPTYLHSAMLTALGVIPGGLLAPPEGEEHWRPGVEAPAEIVTFDRHTYRRLPFAPMDIPSITFSLGVVAKPR